MTVERLALADAVAACTDGRIRDAKTIIGLLLAAAPLGVGGARRYPRAVRVGVPTETKTAEARVALTPDGVRELRHHGHDVVVETGAGEGSSIARRAVRRRRRVHRRRAGGVGRRHGREGQGAAAGRVLPPAARARCCSPISTSPPIPVVARALLDAGTTALAYETVQLPDGSLPLLAPMSEVAGRMATQVGAHYLESPHGGRGVLLGGAPGVRPARVVVIGAGNVGWNAAWIAQGMQAEVLLLDRDLDRLRWVDQIHQGRIMTLASNRGAIERAVASGRPAHRRRARRRWARSPDRHGRDGRRHARRRGDRRRRRRSGWLRRDHARDDPRRSRVHGARRAPLRGRQHAGRGPAHVDLCADQRDAAVRRRRRRPWCRGGRRGRRRAGAGASRPSAGT